MKKKRRSGFLKINFIRKYGVDLWGFLATCSSGKKRFLMKMLRMFCFRLRFKIPMLWRFVKFRRLPFLYSILIPKKKKRKYYGKTYIKTLHTLLKHRTYYGDMTIKKFCRYIRRVNKRRLDFMSKIGLMLESRLDILLYRLNFVRNPRESHKYIKLNKIIINNKVTNQWNYPIYLNDIISFKKDLAKNFYAIFYKKLKEKVVLHNFPKYIEFSYKLMSCMFISFPKKKEIPSLFKTNFAFLRNL